MGSPGHTKLKGEKTVSGLQGHVCRGDWEVPGGERGVAVRCVRLSLMFMSKFFQPSGGLWTKVGLSVQLNSVADIFICVFHVLGDKR